MPTCSYCKKHYHEHKGLTVFTFDGKRISYCSSKCQRNNKLKRDPKKVDWIKRKKKGEKVVRVSVEELKETKGEETLIETTEKPAEEKKEEKKVEEKVEKK